MSRSKKTWDQFVDYYGNYTDWEALGGIPGPKGEVGVGQEGQKGMPGIKGSKGSKGADAAPFLEYKGEVASQGDLPPAPFDTVGHVYFVADTNYLYISNGDGTYKEIQNLDPLKGDQGEGGDKGEEGPKGEKGIEGIQGIKGEQGLEGDEGDKGEVGQDGSDGQKGDKGSDGAQGLKGQEGSQGTKGGQGQPGTGIDIIGSLDPGDIGPPPSGDCTNAGDAILADDGRLWICDGAGNWVDGGFLQGPEGPQGIQGIEGEQGPDGSRGFPGDQGDKGNPGATGEKGLKGNAGIQGEKGLPGVGIEIIGSIDGSGPPPPSLCTGAGEGLIDENGVIWVCDGSGSWTEIPGVPGSTGSKGDQGDNGNDGSKGEPGEQGIKGQRGEQGVKGTNGLGGPKGDEGKGGEKGIQGNKGEEGKSPFTFKGEQDFVADLPTADNEVGDVWLVDDTGLYYAWDGNNWISVDLSSTTMPEPLDDELVYGRTRVKGEGNGSWTRSVALTGDTMTGALTAPGLGTGPDTSGKSILLMDTGADSYNGGPHELEAREGVGLLFDNELLATASSVESTNDELATLSQAVINNAETIGVIAPTTFQGLWGYDAQAMPADGFYSLVSSDGSYSGVTEMTIHPVADQGVDYRTQFADVTKHQVVTVLRTDAAWGFTARISADPVIDADDVITLQLNDVKGIDNPDSSTDIDGLVTIKVQDIIDPKNINEINNILEGLNGSFNNIADQRGVVWTNDNISLPAFLPSGNSIPNGKLYFNSRYLQLYIYIGGSWLGLL
jgi:hypothetical protein